MTDSAATVDTTNAIASQEETKTNEGIKIRTTPMIDISDLLVFRESSPSNDHITLEGFYRHHTLFYKSYRDAFPTLIESHVILGGCLAQIPKWTGYLFYPRAGSKAWSVAACRVETRLNEEKRLVKGMGIIRAAIVEDSPHYPKPPLTGETSLSVDQRIIVFTNISQMASHTFNGSGITVKTAPHGANKLGSGHTQTHFQPVSNAAALFQGSGQKSKSLKWKRIIQSSFQQQLTQPQLAPLYASSNGFVKGAIDAYNQHHHFVIRPEDVWFAILTQFSCYVNAHAEELRSKFVGHEGKEELEIEVHLRDFGFFAEEMSKLLEKNVVDPELREWILPAFSTTTRDDGVVASILMMGTLQKNFSYTAYFSCGLPSVTLLGTEGDWQNILLRLEKLKNYGDEPTIWYSLLKPVLTRFVQTFQSPDSEEVLDFWQRIAQQSRMGSGPPYLSGWITAFCFWDEEGHLLYRGPESASRRDKQSNPNSFRRRLPLGAQSPSTTDSQKEWNATGSPPFVLDGAEYHSVKIDMVPSGHGSVPVHVNDNGHEFDTTMIAGSVGIMGTSGGKPLQNGEVGLETLQPVSGWWIFENGE